MKKTVLFLLMLSFMIPVTSFAQDAIISTIAKLEKSGSLNKQIFSERREPGTGILISSSSIYEFTDNATAERIIEAFMKCREKATSFNMINDKDSQYSIVFIKNRMKSSYSLFKSKKTWSLFVKVNKISEKSSFNELNSLPASQRPLNGESLTLNLPDGKRLTVDLPNIASLTLDLLSAGLMD